MTIPAGLAFDLTYDGSPLAPTNVGDGEYDIFAFVNDSNYEGTGSCTLVIAKATASVILGDLNQTYDGSPRVIAVSTVPDGLTVYVTYDGIAMAPTNVGDGNYAVSATVNDPNYQGGASDTLVISKATAGITFVGLSQPYDGTPKTVTATTTPVGLYIDIFYDNNAANAGSYPVDAIVTEANFQGSASDTLVITKANQAITFSPEPPATIRKQDTVNLVASAPATSPVIFTVTSGPGVLNGNLLSFTANGTVVITASNAGDNNYNAAPNQQRTIIVTNK